jgi:F-type H+-transporting ATPase subunit a
VNLLLAAEGGDFPDPFPVSELFEFAPIFGEEGALFAFNRVSLLYLVAAAVVCGLMIAAFRQPKLVPTKLQNIMESLVQFIREQIALEVMGPDGLRFVPLLTSIFLFVWVNNFFEVTPFVQFPPTGRMAVPAMLAFLVWALYLLVGMKVQGPLGFWKNAALPSGLPAFVLPLYVPVEIAQLLIIRPLTLAVRLFANMMAGHILLAVLFIAANAFLIDVSGGITELSFNLKGSPIGLVALAFGPAMVAFEIMVGVLQAYIFTILTAVYISGSLHPEH